MKYSGKFVLRVPPILHRKLTAQARERGMSLNQLCLGLIEAAPHTSPTPLVEAVLEMRFPLVGIILFGSRARGDHSPASDTDLLLVLRTGEKVMRSLYREWDQRVSPKLNAEGVEPQFVSLPRTVDDAGGLWFEVAVEGKLLWEEGDRVSHFLRELRAKMAEGKVERRLTHGHSYWIRK